MWSRQKNYLQQHSLSIHRAESSQTRPFSYYSLSVAETRSKVNIYKEDGWATVGEEENGTGGERDEGKRRRKAVIGAREGSWCPGGEK